MNKMLGIPPRSYSDLTPPDVLADRLAPLIGHPFELTGKTRTDGANLRKLVSGVLEGGPLPPAAEDEQWRCVVPKKKGVPRILREFVDTYIVTTGSSYNLQVWNRNPAEPTPQIEYADGSHLRAKDVRFVFARIDLDKHIVRSVVVATPDYIVQQFGKFGKQTVKEQLIITTRARATVLAMDPPILFYSDDENIPVQTVCEADLRQASIHDCPSPATTLGLEAIRDAVVSKLLGRYIEPSATKNRGQELERVVAESLGYCPSDDELLAGGYPDLRHQALEVKVQDSPTVDLGRFSPQFEEDVESCPNFTTRTIRYLIALMDAEKGACSGAVVCPGARLGEHFVYVGDKSFKCQRSIPMQFFEKYDGLAVFNPAQE